MTPTPLQLAWLRLACESAPGEPRKLVSDPWVVAVTEGRSLEVDRAGRPISTCPELAHWWLARLGYRRGWINRSEFGQYHIGTGITRLCARPWGDRREATAIHSADEHPAPGDVLVVDALTPATTHVSVSLGWNGGARSADYGQPGGAVRCRSIAVIGLVGGGHWRLGSRVLHSCLRLRDLGEPEEPEDFASWVAHHGLEVPVSMLDNLAKDLRVLHG